MAGWIKMQLGMDVGLGPGHIVLDADPALPTERGKAPPNVLARLRLLCRGRGFCAVVNYIQVTIVCLLTGDVTGSQSQVATS